MTSPPYQPKLSKAETFALRFGSRERVEWVQNLGCLVCGRKPAQNAHVKGRAAGGTSVDIVPLDIYHHLELHQIGIKTFEARYNRDLTAWAEEIERRWQARLANGVVEP